MAVKAARSCWNTTFFEAAVEGVDALADSHLHVVLDLPGRLDAGLLRAALLSVARDVPELAAVPEPGFFGPRWAAPAEPAWEILDLGDLDEAGATAEEAALYALPFEPLGALPLRARILRLSGHDRLLLRVSHMLGDGGGTKNLCYRLAAAYAALAAGRAPPAWPNRRGYPLPRLLKAFRLRSLHWALLGCLDDAVVNRLARIACPPSRPGARGEARCLRLHLPAERVLRLRTRPRESRPTLNDLVLAAFSRALAASQPPESPARAVQVVVTSDLRLLEGGADDVSNFSALRVLALGRIPLPAPEAHLAATLRATSRWKRGGAGLLASTLAAAMLGAFPRSLVARLVSAFLRGLVAAQGAGVALTNIGPIDADRLDFGSGPCLAAHVKAPLAHPPMLITALTGCAGALDITVAYEVPGHEEEAVQALLAAMDRELDVLG